MEPVKVEATQCSDEPRQWSESSCRSMGPHVWNRIATSMSTLIAMGC